MPEAPDVYVQLVDSTSPPTGAGEPPYPPAIPALANAIFAASGARVRELPITPRRVLDALAHRAADR
jgi:isoquinoline 1-oxidoreductase beta subunit